MSPLLWVLVIGCAASALVGLAAWVAWHRASDEDRGLVKRIARLSFRSKLRLARAMFYDRRIPILVRAIPPALVLYLAMPIDIIPDFIPVLGQLDDVLIVAVAVALLFRFTRREVLEDLVASAEPASGPGPDGVPGGVR